MFSEPAPLHRLVDIPTVHGDGRVRVRNVVYGVGKGHLGDAAHVIGVETTVTL